MPHHLASSTASSVKATVESGSSAKPLARRGPFSPGQVVALLLDTIVALVMPGEIPHVAIGSGILSEFQAPGIGGASIGDVVLAGPAIFIVASAESLLCAVATDQLHSGPRATLNRELFAQGLGNVISGLLGGLPITGVIVRSSTNISAGAHSRASALLHGVWMLLFVLLFSGVLAHVPMAALAALLVHVGVNLMKLKELRKIVEFNEAIVYGVTLADVVFINLLWGIEFGFGLALVLLLRRTAKIHIQTETRGEEIHVLMRGNLSFLSVATVVS